MYLYAAAAFAAVVLFVDYARKPREPKEPDMWKDGADTMYARQLSPPSRVLPTVSLTGSELEDPGYVYSPLSKPDPYATVTYTPISGSYSGPE